MSKPEGLDQDYGAVALYSGGVDLFGISAKKVHKIVCIIQKWYFAKVINTKQMLKMIYSQPSD